MTPDQQETWLDAFRQTLTEPSYEVLAAEVEEARQGADLTLLPPPAADE